MKRLSIKKLLKIITIVLLIAYIPIIAWGIYIYNFKEYSRTGLFPGLAGLGDAILFIILLFADFLFILTIQLIYFIIIYRENKAIDNEQKKKAKGKIIVIISILLVIALLFLSPAILSYLTGAKTIWIEPTYEDVAYLAQNEEWLTTCLINENNYKVTVLKKIKEDTDTHIYTYLGKIEETGELIYIRAKKSYEEKNITKSRTEPKLTLITIEKR